MTESEYTNPIVQYLKDRGTITFKLSDRFTPGVPDVVCNITGTTWFEMKVLKQGETVSARVRKDGLQFFNMQCLARFSRAAYVIRKPGVHWIASPLLLERFPEDSLIPDAFNIEAYRSHSDLWRYLETNPIQFPTNVYHPFLTLVKS